MNNFDLKKFLVENRLTKNSQQLTNEVDGGTGPVKDLKSLKFPNGNEYRLGEPDPNDDGIVVQIQKYPNGYFITGGVYSDPHDYYDDPEFSKAKEAYGYALDFAGNEMDQDDLEGFPG